jgi:esterase/lipase
MSIVVSNNKQNQLVNELKNLLYELENKKNEIKNYLLEIDNKIIKIHNQLNIIDKDKQPKQPINNSNEFLSNIISKKTINSGHRMTNEYEYSGDEYDSDDSTDLIYLLDLPKLFGTN